MKSYLIISVVFIASSFLKCKTPDNVVNPQIESYEKPSQQIHANNSIQVNSADTLLAYVGDTVLVDIPVQFSRGLIWRQVDTLKELHLIGQSSIQRVVNYRPEDFQRFTYQALNIGTVRATYYLVAPYRKDSVTYDTIYKNYIIQKR